MAVFSSVRFMDKITILVAYILYVGYSVKACTDTYTWVDNFDLLISDFEESILQ